MLDDNTQKINLFVSDISAPYRIDKYVYDETEDISRSKLQNLIEKGLISLNGKNVKKNTKIKNGDFIEIILENEEPLFIEAENLPIEIVYEDDDIIIVNKARGMVVHPAIGHHSGTLVNALLYHVNSLSQNQDNFRPGIVHRIDKDTTGLLMVAKNDFSHASLSEQLKNRTVKREYIALVHGGFSESEGKVDAPIGRDKNDRLKMAINIYGKNAVTHYKLIEAIGIYSLLSLKLETGRTHQIRVHMKYIKHPLVGDYVYGSSKSKYSKIGQLLHAKSLGFIHPRTNEYMEFDSDLPEDFKKILSDLRNKQK